MSIGRGCVSTHRANWPYLVPIPSSLGAVLRSHCLAGLCWVGFRVWHHKHFWELLASEGRKRKKFFLRGVHSTYTRAVRLILSLEMGSRTGFILGGHHRRPSSFLEAAGQWVQGCYWSTKVPRLLRNSRAIDENLSEWRSAARKRAVSAAGHGT